MTTTALPGGEFDVLYDDREFILSRLERPLDGQPTPPERPAATGLDLSVTGRFRWTCATGEIGWSRETYGIFAVGQATRPTIQVVLSRSHPEDRAALQQLINRVMRELQDWDLEHRLLLPDGTVKHLHVVAHAVRDDATGGAGYVGAVIDVTAAKESRQALETACAEIQQLKDRLQSENIVLREEIDKTSMFEEIVGTSPPIRAVLAHVSKVAPTDSTVYRLNVFPLDVPALRERRADVPLLVEYFIHRYAKRVGKRIRGVTRETSTQLQSYDWPGNIRELQNVIERAVIVCDSDTLSVDARWLSGRPVGTAPAASLSTGTLAIHERTLSRLR